MNMNRCKRLIAVLVFPLAAVAGEAERLAVLASGAPLAEKARACQQLAVEGGPATVPALAALLGDAQLGEYARAALAPIPGPAADKALRAAVGRLTGPARIGIIQSLGLRRDARAVDELEEQVASRESGVSAAALLALGRIATPDALSVLRRALGHAEPAMRVAAAHGALAAADALRTPQPADAATLCEAIRSADVPVSLQAAATYGLVCARGFSALPMLGVLLTRAEPEIRNAALRAARDLEGPEVSVSLVQVLSQLTPEMQVQVVGVLQDRGDAGARAGLERLAAADTPAVRLAAVRALAALGDGTSVAPLLGALARGGIEAQAAGVTLRALPGDGVDEALLTALRSAAGTQRAVLADLVSDRGIAAAKPLLLDDAGGGDATVARAAAQGLGGLAEPADVPALLGLLLDAQSPEVARALEQSVVKAADGRPDEVLAALSRAATPTVRARLLRVLGRIGGPAAFPPLAAACVAAEPEIRDAAVRSVADWPDAQAEDLLLNLARTAEQPAHRALALRGYLRLLEQAPPEQRATTAAKGAGALAAAGTSDLRKAVLGTLAHMAHPAALELALSVLDDPDTRAEAGLAVVTLAKALLSTDREAVRKAMQEAITSPDPATAAAVRGILAELDRNAPSADSSWPPAVSLFDGVSFRGWEGDTATWFRIESGAIIGGSLKDAIPRNEFLCTTRPYTNFHLRVECRLVGNGNAGIQVRSQRVPNHHEVSGYQADMSAGADGGYWGCLYDESRRNKMLARPTSEVIRRALRPADWNVYEIRCEGPRVQLWLNGVLTVDYTESDAAIPAAGIIGLQIHGGGPSEAWYRNITVSERP
jgi:HEAT repeat protein